jgi:hypothetical protein
MRPFFLSLFLVACAGPGQDTLAKTPTATTRRTPSLAPPSNNADKDRYQLNEQFEEMRDAEQAHREASHESAPPPAPVPAATGSGAPGSPTPPVKKRGPAEQAPAPPRSTTK